MPAVSVTSSYNRSVNDITLLANYIVGTTALEAKYQYMISEVVMLRLFSIMESTFAEVAFKLACGATYRNGNNPVILRRCRSILDAYSNMLSHNRTRSLRYLQWTKATFVKDSIEHILDLTDHFYINLQNHSVIINEMRIVRNHIAHRSSSTRQDYIALLRTKYGGNPNLTIGAFLTSTNRNPTSNISSYIQTTRIVLNDITNG